MGAEKEGFGVFVKVSGFGLCDRIVVVRLVASCLRRDLPGSAVE